MKQDILTLTCDPTTHDLLEIRTDIATHTPGVKITLRSRPIIAGDNRL